MKKYWWQLWPNEPVNNSACVGLYSDGSGSFLFYVDELGHIYDTQDELMDKEYFDESVSYWTYLPDGFEFRS